MLSLTTNFPSLIAQHSLKNSTAKLNQAIERMSTGFKVNHASDNAANYSISTNMTTKIGALMVAEDNTAMGLDLINTANENLSLMSDHLTRIRALAEQASNGTYGESSKKAINSEVNARVNEMLRIYDSTMYNGINLFGEELIEIAMASLSAPRSDSKFLEEIVRIDTSSLEALSSVDTLQSGKTYAINTLEDLQRLEYLVNSSRQSTCNTTFVLGDNIDLSGVDWTPIGYKRGAELRSSFEGTFDGNGYEIRNLTRQGDSYISEDDALFGYIQNGAVIKNLGVTNVNIDGLRASAIAAEACGATIRNCYASGNVSGLNSGGLVCYGNNLTISACYSSVNVSSGSSAGGLAGSLYNGSIENSYSTGDVTASDYSAGGLVGALEYSTIKNSYATGNVTGNATGRGINGRGVGGIVGNCIGSDGDIPVSNCYFSGKIIAPADSNSGGIIGLVPYYVGVKDCYVLTLDTGYAAVVGCAPTAVEVVYDNVYTQTPTSKDWGGYRISYAAGFDRNSACSYTGGAPFTLDFWGGSSGETDPPVVPEVPETPDVPRPAAGNIIFQVGTNSDSNSSLVVDTKFSISEIHSLLGIGLDNEDYLSIIDSLQNQIFAKQSYYGAIQNRLDSALEEISTQYRNLASSRSTLQDADIAKVSSLYIQQQILQQASATLLATANQTPALALQLL